MSYNITIILLIISLIPIIARIIGSIVTFLKGGDETKNYRPPSPPIPYEHQGLSTLYRKWDRGLEV